MFVTHFWISIDSDDAEKVTLVSEEYASVPNWKMPI
jgi:hypothetical protein